MLYAILIVSAEAVSQLSEACNLQNDVFFQGADLKYETNMTSEACCTLCQQTQGCGAFSHSQYDAKGQAIPSCYIFSKGLAPKASNGAVSGTVIPAKPTPSPPQPTPSPQPGHIDYRNALVNKVMDANADLYDKTLFSLLETHQQSTLYKWKDLNTALYSMSVGAHQDHSSSPLVTENRTFWLGSGIAGANADKQARYALVNLAAFIGQAYYESIEYDTCDETNWDDFPSQSFKYPVSNACGQEGRNYSDPSSAYCSQYACQVDKNMAVTAGPTAKDKNDALYCKPGKGKGHGVGYYNGLHLPWKLVEDPIGYKNRAGFSDVEGCCWWGRGAIQTTGVCNYGRINHFIGAKSQGNIHIDVDFCKHPESVCSAHLPELKWTVGLFFWTDVVQANPTYFPLLRALVDGTGSNGLQDAKARTGFVDKVSKMVNGGEVPERAPQFEIVLKAFGLI
jgi:hypothetical protein